MASNSKDARIERLSAITKQQAKELRDADNEVAQLMADNSALRQELARVTDGRYYVARDPDEVTMATELRSVRSRIVELERELTPHRLKNVTPIQPGK